MGLVVAALQTIGLWGKTGTDFAGMVYLDSFSCFFYMIFILGAALTILISRQYLEDYGKNLGEYYALILFATMGMMLMAAGRPSHHDLPGPRSHVHRGLRPGGPLP